MMKFLLLAIAATMFVCSAEARLVDITCTAPSLDVNGNPVNLLGVRFYADGQQIADEPGCTARVDIADGTYDFTAVAYNAIGNSQPVGPVTFRVGPDFGVPEAPTNLFIALPDSGSGPPDLTYVSTSPSADSIHPGLPAGTSVRVWIVDGLNVFVGANGSTMASSDYWAVSWSYQLADGTWSAQQLVEWQA